VNTNPNELEVLISAEEIKHQVQRVGKQLDQIYAGKELTIILIMKGAICLVSDLIRTLHIPHSIEFVRGSSYGQQGTKRGALTLFGIDSLNLAGKNVLVVDDIFDSGVTLFSIVHEIQKQHPHSIRTLVLLSKKVPRAVDFTPDHVLFEVENRFVVGYGLDYKEHYRGLSTVSAFKVEPK
jgi:hypoxanthine phosphoribosyltransferase